MDAIKLKEYTESIAVLSFDEIGIDMSEEENIIPPYLDPEE